MLLYYGSPDGPSTEPDWTLQGEATTAAWEKRCCLSGDVNGDGYDDIAEPELVRPTNYRS